MGGFVPWLTLKSLTQGPGTVPGTSYGLHQPKGNVTIPSHYSVQKTEALWVALARVVVVWMRMSPTGIYIFECLVFIWWKD